MGLDFESLNYFLFASRATTHGCHLYPIPYLGYPIPSISLAT